MNVNGSPSLILISEKYNYSPIKSNYPTPIIQSNTVNIHENPPTEHSKNPPNDEAPFHDAPDANAEEENIRKRSLLEEFRANENEYALHPPYPTTTRR